MTPPADLDELDKLIFETLSDWWSEASPLKFGPYLRRRLAEHGLGFRRLDDGTPWPPDSNQ